MRERKYTKRRKVNLKQMVISLTALLLILVVGVSITYSWIEGGTTYTMQSENNNIKTAAVPEDTKHHGKLYLVPDDTVTDVNISAFDETTTGDLIFSPVSSKDGENFYFPVKDSEGNVATYRKATTNDIGTKFIAFDFDVCAEKNFYMSFAETPTITIENSSGNVINNVDLSAFRMMISSNNTGSVTTHVFSGDGSLQTTEVVTGLNSGAAATESFTTEKLSDFVYDSSDPTSNTLFTFDTSDTNSQNTKINVSVWLDSSADSEVLSALKGCKATVNMKLKAVEKLLTTTIYIEKRSNYNAYDVYAYSKQNGVTTELTGTWPGSDAVLDTETPYYKYVFTSSVSGDFRVIISNNKANQYPADDGNDSTDDGLLGTLGGTYFFPAGSPTELTPLNDNSFITVKTSSITETAVSTTGGTTKVGGETSQKVLPGGQVVLTATPKTGYKFVGWYTNSACTTTIGTNYANASTTATVTGSAGSTVTYYAKFASYINVKAHNTPSGSGTALVNGAASVQVSSGTTVNLLATPADHYKFVGWYTNSACTTTIGSNYTNASTTATATGTPGSTVNYYAKFLAETYTVVAHAVSDGKMNNTTLGQIKISTDTSYSGVTGASGTYGSDLTFNAQVKSGGEFVGWYDAVTGGNKLSDELTYTLEISGSTNIYARFVPETVTKRIYFKPIDSWKTSSARFAAYVFSDDKTQNHWYSLTGDSNGYYYFDLEETDWSNIIFCRMDGANTTNDWSNCWNQTADLVISGTNDCFIHYTGKSGVPAENKGFWTEYTSGYTTLVFDATSTTWVTNDSAVMWAYDTSASKQYQMSKVSGENYVFYTSVPNSATNITFHRCSSSGFTTSSWNSWAAGARGVKHTYKTTGSGTGSWQ